MRTLFFTLLLLGFYHLSAQNGPICADLSLPLADNATTLSISCPKWPAQLQVGKTVFFTVQADITQENEVLIAAGARAKGRVAAIEWDAMGNLLSVRYTVESVQTTAGPWMSLSTAPCAWAALDTPNPIRWATQQGK